MNQERFVNIEPDMLKRFHRRYSECMSEETDSEVHRWSVRRAVDAFEEAVENTKRENVLFDSSGSNAEWLGDRLRTAQAAGYRTELLWVDVPVEVALFRNRNRAKRHGQWCPEHIITDKAKVMRHSFEELRHMADSAERLQNWDPKNDELKTAELDIHFYPAPRTRIATVRPGDEGYGEAPEGARTPSPRAGSRRTIRIGPWKRDDVVMKAKNARLKWMDETYRGNRERFVLEEVLAGREIFLEKNKFPYFLPPGIEHWTIWARKEMDDDQLCEYIEGYLDARRPHNVIAWNYDDNRNMRTIDIWHVHIYFQGAGGEPPRFCIQSQEDRGGDSRSGRSDKLLRGSALRSPCSV